MRDIVHRRFVNQDQVLIRRATPNVKTGGAFARTGHPRKRLNGFDDVGFSQQRG